MHLPLLVEWLRTLGESMSAPQRAPEFHRAYAEHVAARVLFPHVAVFGRALRRLQRPDPKTAVLRAWLPAATPAAKTSDLFRQYAAEAPRAVTYTPLQFAHALGALVRFDARNGIACYSLGGTVYYRADPARIRAFLAPRPLPKRRTRPPSTIERDGALTCPHRRLWAQCAECAAKTTKHALLPAGTHAHPCPPVPAFACPRDA